MAPTDGLHSAFDRALEHPPLLLDGAIGSLLIAQGLEAGRAPERWLLEHPGRIAATHRAYAEAGCDLVHTVTFGASPPKLAEAGLGGRCREICAAAVAIARGAVGPTVLVAGDIGPTGRLLPPMGSAHEEELEAAFREQAEALASAGVDCLSIETMFDLREAQAAVRAAAATGLPVLASMTFDRKKRGYFTLVGNRVADALSGLVEAGARVVGCNCTLGSTEMVELVAEAVAAVAAPVVAQPNAGSPELGPGGVTYPADPGTFARDVVAMVERGAALVGGCCGTDPSFLRTVRAALDARRSR